MLGKLWGRNTIKFDLLSLALKIKNSKNPKILLLNVVGLVAR
jgi:hypothetical protein